jgi:hypothetical protein
MKMMKRIPLFPVIPVVPVAILFGSLATAIHALLRVRRVERRMAGNAV